jgi:hypothetical protein
VGRFARSLWGPGRPWLAIALLVLLFGLPDGVRDGAFRPRSLRISGDLLALLTLAASSYKVRWGGWIRPWLLVHGLLLLVFRIDRVIVHQLMYEEPLLYDQLFMARHLVVLIHDLWSPAAALLAAASLLGIVLLAWVTTHLLREARTLVMPRLGERSLSAIFALWLLTMLGSVTDVVGLTRASLVRWSSPVLADNVERSIATYRRVRERLADSPYRAYQKVSLKEKPELRLFVLESYGRVIWANKDSRAYIQRLLSGLQERLTQAGVHSVSSFSTANVRGARSWLADATMLVGASVENEAFFQHAMQHIRKQPTLLSFLNAQGYDTTRLAPADRPRLGLRTENPYGYDRILDFAAVGYTGKPYGWGVVPDQYALGFYNENIAARVKEPSFLFFHTVTAHAPWQKIPPLVEDWRTLNDARGKQVELKPPAWNTALRGLALRFDRSDTGIDYRPALDKFMRGYLESVRYTLEVFVSDIIGSTRPDRITIVVGDHQPPLITSLKSSYDTPIHVFSRDRASLDVFRRHGFTDGLALPTSARSAMSHAGLFSLLVHTLAGDSRAGLPPTLPRGYELDSGRAAR